MSKRAAAIVVLVPVLVLGCSRPRYLGAAMPAPCTERDVDGCLGWMVERDLIAAELGVYDDPALRRYVQEVADRLARGSLLARAPRIWIGDRDGTYATVGGRIVVARPTLERLGSEAELAGVLAHEIAHLEGRHTVASLFGPAQDAAWRAARLDAEAIADERAVFLLERAGYAPAAMSRALASVLHAAEDDEHPEKDVRIERVDELARGRAGFEGRAELLHRLERMIVGRDTRLGVRVGDAWVIAAAGVALPLEDGDVLRSADELLVLRRDRATLTSYVIGAPWARELGAGLLDRDTGTIPSHSDDGRVAPGIRVTAGTVPRVAAAEDSPLGKLRHAIRGSLPQPPAGAEVAILEHGTAALVIELGGHHVLDLDVRVATPDELAAAEPRRISLARAPRAGAIASLEVCRGRLLDDPSRRVAAGDPIKCADRASRRPPRRAPTRAPARAHVIDLWTEP